MAEAPNIATAVSNTSEPPAVLRQWKIRPVIDQPQRVVPIIALCLFVLVVGYLTFHTIWPAIAGVLMLLGATSEYLLTTNYRLTERGAHADCGVSRFEIEWSKVKRLLISDNAVTLSPLPRPSRLDAFRGVNIRFSSEKKAQRDEIMAMIEERVARSRAGDTTSNA
ncbi:MAG: hypothetical protein ABJA67_15935 [Chthonomonadales bacterium]